MEAEAALVEATKVSQADTSTGKKNVKNQPKKKHKKLS
jgi:hypothetical protein